MKRTLQTNADIEKSIKDYAEKMPSVSNDGGEALKSLGLGKIDGISTEDKNVTSDTQMAVVAAKNTKITYNGAIIESDTTNISVAGLELNILSETAEGKQSIFQ